MASPEYTDIFLNGQLIEPVIAWNAEYHFACASYMKQVLKSWTSEGAPGICTQNCRRNYLKQM